MSIDTSYNDQAKELTAMQVQRFLDSDLSAEEFLSRPFEEQCTTYILRLHVEHLKEIRRKIPGYMIRPHLDF